MQPPGYGPPPGYGHGAPPGYPQQGYPQQPQHPGGYGPPPNPYGGYPGGPPPKKGMSVWAYLGIGALVLFGGCVAVCAVAVNQGGKEAKKNQEEYDDAKSLKVTADELVEAYEKNEIAADEKYKGKKLRISGAIDRIESNFSDEPMIVLKSKSFIGVNCEGISKKDAAKLSKGDEITLECKGDGEIISIPQLKDCKKK